MITDTKINSAADSINIDSTFKQKENGRWIDTSPLVGAHSSHQVHLDGGVHVKECSTAGSGGAAGGRFLTPDAPARARFTFYCTTWRLAIVLKQLKLYAKIEIQSTGVNENASWGVIVIAGFTIRKQTSNKLSKVNGYEFARKLIKKIIFDLVSKDTDQKWVISTAVQHLYASRRMP